MQLLYVPFHYIIKTHTRGFVHSDEAAMVNLWRLGALRRSKIDKKGSYLTYFLQKSNLSSQCIHLVLFTSYEIPIVTFWGFM